MYSIGFVFNSSVSYQMYHIHFFFLLDVKEAEFSIHKMIPFDKLKINLFS